MSTLLYIGFAVDKETQNKSPYVSVAGNKFQLGILEGLKANFNLKIFSILPTATWPTGNCIQKKRIVDENGMKLELIPFINIRIFKELSLMATNFVEVLRYCLKNREKVIITYNGEAYYTIPIRILKKFFKFKYICMMVDPPLYEGTTNRSGYIWKVLYQLKALAYKKAVKVSDGIIILNKGVLNQWDLHEKKAILIEGGVNICDFQFDEDQMNAERFDNNYFNIVFSGVLHEHSGILSFVKIFKEYNNPKVRLYIFGDGVFKEAIEREIANSENIFMCGTRTNAEILKIQKSADLLICPNEIEHPINQGAFPSKLLEYMMSGTPVIATALPCLKGEYQDYLFLYDGMLKTFSVQMNKLLSMSRLERQKIGEKARQFIIYNKSWKSQSEKISEWIEELD